MRIQQAAFAKGKPFLKGALHCHSTRSDGKGTPEEVAACEASYTGQYLAPVLAKSRKAEYID